MATITSIRQGLVDTVLQDVPELFGFHAVPDVTQVPCIVVRPGKLDYVVAGGTCWEATFEMYVLVSRSDSVGGQDKLDAYLSTTGAKSIPATLRARPGIGVSGAYAQLVSMERYGGHWDAAQIPHIGAQLNVRVLVTE